MTNEQRLELANAIAEALGWSITQPHEGNPHYLRMESPKGVTVSLHMGGAGHKGRVAFDCSYPYHQSSAEGLTRYTCQRDFDRSLKYNDAPWDGITVSDQKSPEQIAKDFTRRFLPVYLLMWAKAVEYYEQQAAYWAKRRSAETQIKEAIKDVPGLRIDYMGSDYAQIGITASPELAKVITEAVKGFHAGNKSA